MTDDKRKRKGRSKPQKPPLQSLRPEQLSSGRVSMAQERFIGRVTVAWAKLEALLNDLIWAMTGLKIEDGRLLTERQDATRLLTILRALAERYLSDDGSPSPRSRFLDTLDFIDQLKDDRNAIIHGSWGELDGIPIIASLRLKTNSPSKVTSENYPAERMLKIARDIDRCKKIMGAFLNIFEAWREKPVPPVHENSETLPQDQ
jgi:hypothetical protein